MTMIKKQNVLLYWPIAFVYIGAYPLAYICMQMLQGPMGGMFMSFYMGFVLVLFGLLKINDVKGFAKSFAKYDPIAKRSSFYAKAYPCIEIVLGVLFIVNIFMISASVITIFIYTATLYGALCTMIRKETLHCACAGTQNQLPLSHVSTIESIVMIGMCVYMLFEMFGMIAMPGM